MLDLTQFMKTRRSSLSITLEGSGPDKSELRSIVEIATRVPDHGKLAPWRIELWEPSARTRMHAELLDLLDEFPELPDLGKKKLGTDKLLHAPCVLAVISKAEEHPKVPIWEQQLSAGAVCMNTLIAANSLGYEAQWLTAWYVYEETANSILGLHKNEKIAGIIHIGTSASPKKERDRPNHDSVFSIRES